MKLKPLALGLALGLVWGVGLFILTIWINIVGPGSTLGLLGKVYLGYSVSIGGAFVGLIYGFVDGFIGGLVVGWLYNIFAKEKTAPAAGQTE